MTVINNIEIDAIEYKTNNTREAILNNEPIDDVLHVIIVISNPCQYATRYILAKQFIKRLESYEHVELYVVELAYGRQNHYITNSGNPQHLQLRTDSAPLWHKENMVNIGIRRLLPSQWKAVAWVDADIEFENCSWALDTLKILNGYKDVVQLFSHAVDMGKHEETMRVFTSFGYQYENKRQYVSSGLDFWHPGYAWACSRRAYEKMGGLYQNSILGSGDHNMAYSFMGWGRKSVNNLANDEYLADVLEFQKRVGSLRLGYVTGVIKHYYHGSKSDRKYSERWQILVKHQYNPREHMTLNADGLLVPTGSCPTELLEDIMNYFRERNEDS